MIFRNNHIILRLFCSFIVLNKSKMFLRQEKNRNIVIPTFFFSSFTCLLCFTTMLYTTTLLGTCENQHNTLLHFNKLCFHSLSTFHYTIHPSCIPNLFSIWFDSVPMEYSDKLKSKQISKMYYWVKVGFLLLYHNTPCRTSLYV